MDRKHSPRYPEQEYFAHSGPFSDKMTCSLVISERSRIVKAGLHLPGCVAGRQKTALAKLITDQKRETWYGEKYAMEQETEVCSMGFFGGGEAFFALGR